MTEIDTNQIESKFCLRHSGGAFIKQVVAPPRLCEWTKDIEEAQQFEVEWEAIAARDYVKTVAFNVEVINKRDYDE